MKTVLKTDTVRKLAQGASLPLTWAPGFLEKNGQSVRTGSPAPSTLRIAARPPQDGDPQAGGGDSRVLEPVLLPWARVSGERACS